MTVAQTLLDKRNEQGLLQKEVATMANIPVTSLSRWESGARLPALTEKESLKRLADILGLDYVSLWERVWIEHGRIPHRENLTPEDLNKVLEFIRKIIKDAV